MNDWTPDPSLNWEFGLAWLAFTLALGLHVWDEASHDFLATYNPHALAIRRRVHLPVPIFTARVWLSGLAMSIFVLLLLTPLAFHGVYWVRMVAVPLGLLAGVVNAFLHLGGSILYRRPLAGLLSSPLLLAAGVWLLWTGQPLQNSLHSILR